MTNALTFMLFAIILFANTILMLSWGIRIGKSLQKETPSVPLEEPAEQVAGIVKKIGKRTVRLVGEIKELKAVKGNKREETDVWN